MMKNNVSRKLVSVLVVALFMLSFAGTAVSKEAKGKELKEVAGTISVIKPDVGKVAIVEKESHRVVILTAGSDVDLKDFSVGDQVVAEYTPDHMVIKSITKQG